MSRIPPITDPKSGPMAELFDKAQSWMGFLPNDGLLMAHKPEMLQAFFDLATAIYAPGKVDSALKRMIGHITSRASGCQYCSAHTSYGAGKQGVSKEKLEAVWEFETSPLFPESERVALRVALKAAMVPNQVTDADFDTLIKYYDREAIVEIVGVISLFGFLNRWNGTFNTDLEAAPNNFYKSIKKEQHG